MALLGQCVRIDNLDRFVELSDLKQYFQTKYSCSCSIVNIETVMDGSSYHLAVALKFDTLKAAASVLVDYDGAELFGCKVSVSFWKGAPKNSQPVVVDQSEGKHTHTDASQLASSLKQQDENISNITANDKLTKQANYAVPQYHFPDRVNAGNRKDSSKSNMSPVEKVLQLADVTKPKSSKPPKIAMFDGYNLMLAPTPIKSEASVETSYPVKDVDQESVYDKYRLASWSATNDAQIPGIDFQDDECDTDAGSDHESQSDEIDEPALTPSIYKTSPRQNNDESNRINDVNKREQTITSRQAMGKSEREQELKGESGIQVIPAGAPLARLCYITKGDSTFGFKVRYNSKERQQGNSSWSSYSDLMEYPVISGIDEDSPAANVDLRKEDRIIELAGRSMRWVGIQDMVRIINDTTETLKMLVADTDTLSYYDKLGMPITAHMSNAKICIGMDRKSQSSNETSSSSIIPDYTVNQAECVTTRRTQVVPSDKPRMKRVSGDESARHTTSRSTTVVPSEKSRMKRVSGDESTRHTTSRSTTVLPSEKSRMKRVSGDESARKRHSDRSKTSSRPSVRDKTGDTPSTAKSAAATAHKRSSSSQPTQPAQYDAAQSTADKGSESEQREAKTKRLNKSDSRSLEDSGNQQSPVCGPQVARVCYIVRPDKDTSFGLTVAQSQPESDSKGARLLYPVLSGIAPDSPADHHSPAGSLRLHDSIINIDGVSTWGMEPHGVTGLFQAAGCVLKLLIADEGTVQHYEMLGMPVPHPNAMEPEQRPRPLLQLPLQSQPLMQHPLLQPQSGALWQPPGIPRLCCLYTWHGKNVTCKGYGFTIASDPSDNNYHIIHGIETSSPAAASGAVMVHDVLLEVNGHSVVGWSCADIMSMIVESCKTVSLLLVDRPTLQYYISSGVALTRQSPFVQRVEGVKTPTLLGSSPNNRPRPPVVGGYMRPPLLGGYMRQPVVGGYMGPPVVGGYMGPPVVGGYMGPPPVGGYMGPPVVGGYMRPPPVGGCMGPPMGGFTGAPGGVMGMNMVAGGSMMAPQQQYPKMPYAWEQRTADFLSRMASSSSGSESQ